MPTYVNHGAGAGHASSITPALPASIQVDDILLLFVESAAQTPSITNQNGGTWTLVDSSSQGTPGTVTASRIDVFWSRYNGTQGSPTVELTGDHLSGHIAAFRGVKTSGDPWNVKSTSSEDVADTSLSITGATTTAADCLVVITSALMDDNQNFGATWTNADLASITARLNFGTTAGNDGRHIVVTGEKATAGAYGNTTNTLTANSRKANITIALEGATSAATGSGSPTLGDVTSAGTGTVLNPVTGSGSPTLGNVTSSGTGAESMTGSGSPSLANVTAAGTGQVAPPVTGTGSPSLADVTAVGTGQLTISGSGSPTLANVTAGGTGAVLNPVTGSGSPTLGDATSSGTGTVTSGTSGSGAPVLEDVTSSGSGQLTISGSGSPALGSVVSAGAGVLTISGTGAPVLADVTAAGAGVVIDPVTGSGTPDIADVTAAGSGLVAMSVTGTGAPVLANVRSTGTGIGGIEEPELEPAGRARRRPQGFW